MGYNTNFHIKAIDLKPDSGRPVFDLDFFEEVNLHQVGVGERKDGRFALGDGESYKWCEHEEDLCNISSQYIDVVHLDWHIWVFLAHFFIWCARHAHRASDFCMAESGSMMHIEKRKRK